MKFVFFLLLLLSSPLFAQEAPYYSTIAQKFVQEIDCSAQTEDLHRGWCAVAKIGLTPFEAPKKKSIYLGYSIKFPKGATVKGSIDNTIELAALMIDSKTAKVVSLAPSNEDEKKQLTQIVFSLAAITRGMGGQVSVTKELNQYLVSESKNVGHPYQITGTSANYTAALPSNLFFVSGMWYGSAYVLIEQGDEGDWVSLFPVLPIQVEK